MAAASEIWSCDRVSSDELLEWSPPALLDERADCVGPSPSQRQARRLEREAKGRAERYPYDPRDGVRGALLLFQASACYRAAGLLEDVVRADAAGRRLAHAISSDYAAARIALDRALENQRWGEAREHVRRLLRFTDHIQAHPYVEWLRYTDSQLYGRDDTAR